MGPLRNLRLSSTGAFILAAVSLAATIVILAGGGSTTNAQLAAATALKHPLRAVEQVQTAPATTPSSAASDPGSGAGANISPPASDSSGGAGDPGSGASAGSNSSDTNDTSDGSDGATSSDGASGAGASADGDASSGSLSAAATTATAATTTTAANAGLPKVGHVFLLTLSTTDYRDAFAARSPAPYLHRLARRGTVLSGFHALGRNGLIDLLAMVSGQPPNPDTTTGCPRYVAYPANATLTAAGIARGKGCVYPDAALTVADQVNAAGKTWGAYVADEGLSNCPVPTTGESRFTPLDGTQAGYDVAHNPFAFFGSLLDAGGCSEYDSDLDKLTRALARRSATPNLTYVGGDACVDADPKLAPAATATTATTTTPTATTATATTATATATAATATTTAAATMAATTTTGATTPGATTTSTVPARLRAPAAYGCPAGETSGIAGEDAFLKTWVPKILASAAYRANGVLVIAFTGANGRPRADTGALVISRWTPRHKRIKAAYTAYSLLRSVEDMLDLAPLAKATDASSFAKLVLR